MYEYRTQTHYGFSPPEILTPPTPAFRLRDIKPVVTGENEVHTVSDRSSLIYNSTGAASSIMIPFTTNLSRGRSVQWIIIWERYVPEQENE
jgi:hypothetical protein